MLSTGTDVLCHNELWYSSGAAAACCLFRLSPLPAGEQLSPPFATR